MSKNLKFHMFYDDNGEKLEVLLVQALINFLDENEGGKFNDENIFF